MYEPTSLDQDLPSPQTQSSQTAEAETTATPPHIPELSFPQLRDRLTNEMAAVRSTIEEMLAIFSGTTSIGTLRGVRGRIARMKATLRGKDSLDSVFNRQAKTLAALLPLKTLDKILAAQCTHEDLQEFKFSDGQVVRRCLDCGSFDKARKEVLAPAAFDPFKILKSHTEGIR